jgi:hypothetical protein
MVVKSFIVVVAEILSDSAFSGRNYPVLQAKRMYSYFLRVVVYQIGKNGIGAPSDSGPCSLLAIFFSRTAQGDCASFPLRYKKRKEHRG